MEGKYVAFAPMQGYTDAAYRRAHCECAGGVGEYYAPFVRLEKGHKSHKAIMKATALARYREAVARIVLVPDRCSSHGRTWWGDGGL